MFEPSPLANALTFGVETALFIVPRGVPLFDPLRRPVGGENSASFDIVVFDLLSCVSTGADTGLRS